MADAQANINVNVDTSQALASIRALQAEISRFQQQMLKLNANSAAQAASMQRNLINSINATGQFSARMATITSTTESFTNALEKNKFKLGEYFKYAGAASQTFGRFFRNEFDTIDKVARERVKTLQTQYIKLGRDANGALQSIAVRPLVLDMQNLTTQTMMAAQKQQLFNQLIKQGSTNLLNWGKNTQWAGRQLMVGFTIPLTIMGSMAAKSFMELEEQAIRFKRVYGELFTTPAQADEMFGQLQKLGSEFTKYGVALADTMKMAADAAAMGKTGADLLGQVEQASRLAVLGQVDQQQALETTISLTNAFGVATEDLTGKINFLNAVENQTVTSIEDLTEAIPKAGPVIQQLGGDVEDLAFFLTAMKEGGINASEGANALKSGLASIINPTEKASQFLAGFGINLKGIVEANKGDIKGTVVAFAQALDTLDPLNRAQAIEQLFGKFQFARLSTLFQNVIAEGSQASRVLKLTSASTEELAILAERELRRVEESPLFKFRKAWEDLQAALAPVGEEFLKAVTPIIEFGTKILEKFNEMGDGGKRFVTLLVAGLGVVAPILLMTIGLLANGVANIIKFVAAVRNMGQGSSGIQQLGMQTEYMTQQQLEAAAVASALNQTHSSLRQTFTSEAAAVAALTKAYQGAVGAQRAFMGAPGLGATAGKRPTIAGRFASGGVIRGPGSGTSDSILAMVSNGEAIIPAKAVKQNPGMVNQLISGNIPGFFTGVNFGGQSFPASSRSIAGIEKLIAQTQALSSVITNIDDLILTAITNATNDISAKGRLSTQRLREELARVGGGAIPMAGTVAAGVAPSNTGIVAAHGTPRIIMSQAEARAMGQGIASTNPGSPVAAGLTGAKGNVGAYSNLVFGMPAAFNKQMMTGLESSAFIKQYPQVFTQYIAKMAKLSPNDPGLILFANNVARALERAGSSAVTESMFEEIIAAELKQQSTSAATKGMKGTQALLQAQKTIGAVDILVPGASRTRREAVPGGPSYRNIRIDESANVAANAFVADTVRNRAVGSAIVEGTAAGVKDNVGKAKKAGAEVGKAAVAGVTQSGRTSRRVATGVIDTPVRAMMVPDPARPGAFIPENRLASRLEAMRRLDAMRASQQAQAAQPVTRPRMGGGAIGMGAMTLGMVGGMLPGKAGEVASQLSMPLMAIGMLSMLPPQIALVVAALGAIAGTAYGLVSAFDRGAKKTREFTEAMGAGTKNIEAFAEFSGRVTASQIMTKRIETQMSPFAIQPGETTVGQAFVQGEAGAAMIADISASMEKLGQEETTRRVVRQLAAAVSSGALEAIEAKSILSALATELGNYSFGINASAQLGEIIGPNGENLATDSLKVRVQLIQEGQAEIAALEQPALTDFVTGQQERIKKVFEEEGFWAAIGASFKEKWEQMLGTAVLGGPGILLGMFADASEESGMALGEAAATMANNLQLTRDSIAAEELKYQRLIETARAQNQLNEVQRLQEERTKSRNSLAAEENSLLQQAINYYRQLSGIDQAGFIGELRTGIEQQFAGTGQEGAIAGAFERIREAGISGEQEVKLLLNLRAGNIQAATLDNLLKLIGGDQAALTQYFNLEAQVDNTTFGMITQLATLFETGDQAISFITTLEGATTDEIYQYVDAFSYLQKIQASGAVGTELVMGFFLENPEAALKFQEISQQIINTPDIEKNNLLNFNVNGIEEAIGASNIWDSLDEAGQKNYTMVITALLQMAGDPQMIAAYKNWLAGGNEGSFADFTGFSADQIIPQITDVAANMGDGGLEDLTSGGGGGGPKSSWLDPIVKQMRDFVNVQQELTQGWDESLAAIMEFAKGGVAGFKGLSNQMRRVGVTEPLIEKILGMSPEEWEEQKAQIFNFDALGNITGLTEAGKAIQDALNTATIGQFINEQENITVSVGNQITALQKLTAAGASYQAAYRAVQNTALAAAIATSKSSAEIQAAAKAAMEAQAMMDKFEEINEEEMRKERISEAVREMNRQFSDQAKILDYINKNRSKLTEAQISAILENDDLRSLVLEPNIDPNALKTALANANKQAELELKIKKLTVEGQEEIFQEGLSNAMSAFNAKEQEIELKFKAKVANDEDLARVAQQQIDKIEFELDNYNAALQEIDWAEQKINDSYDKRFEALDRISELNDQITASQQKQLDLANALATGDIAGAARAAQELRAQQQEDAIANQRRMMETAQQAEIRRVRSTSGLSREELEARILELEQQRFGIEENTLEPAQERIRLAELQRDAQIADLEVLGKTRDEWERIANSVDVAQANGWRFADSMREALGIVDELIANFLNRPVAAGELSIGGGGGGGGGGSRGGGGTAPAGPTGTGISTPRNYFSNMSSSQFFNTKRAMNEIGPRTPQKGPSAQGRVGSQAPRIPSPGQSSVSSTVFGGKRYYYQPRTRAMGGMIAKLSMGGIVPSYFPMGGMIPYKADGGFFKPLGSDTIPAMLTPGEFVIRRPAVNGFGADNLEKINRGTYQGNSMYNYNLEVNVKSDANPDQIARTVMSSIKQVEGRRLRGNQL